MEHSIPEFLQNYYAGCNEGGKAEILQLSSEFRDERATYLQTSFVKQASFQKDWNRLMGTCKVLKPDDAVAHIQEKYTSKAQSVVEKQNAMQDRNLKKQAFQSNLKSVSDRQNMRPRLR